MEQSVDLTGSAGTDEATNLTLLRVQGLSLIAVVCLLLFW